MTPHLRLVTQRGVLSVVAIGAVILLPQLLNSFQLGVLMLSLILALTAIGVNLMAGQAGLVSLGHAGIMAASGYGLATMQVHTDAPMPVQVAVAFLAAVVLSILFGLMSMRTDGIYFFMATTAQGLLIWGLGMRFTSFTGGETGIRGIDRPPAVDDDRYLFYLVAVVVILAIFAYRLIVKSPVGIILRALSGSPSRLGMLGYNVRVYKVYVFALSGIFAGASGILFVYYNRFISPDAATFLMSGKILLMVLIGGVGFTISPIVGGVLVIFIENFVGTVISRWPTVLGLLYIVVVLFAREGLIGAAKESWQKVRRRIGNRRQPIVQVTKEHPSKLKETQRDK